MAAGAVLVVAGALGTAALVSGASDRVDVLAVASDVRAGEQITADDVRVAAVAEDPALQPIPAAEKDAVIGKRAGADLAAGTLLTQGQLSGGSGLRAGESMVAVEAKRGMAPLEALTPGSTVQIVATPGKDGTASSSSAASEAKAGSEVEARVVRVGRPDASGSAVVQVAVSSTDASQVAAQAATGKAALVLAGG